MRVITFNQDEFDRACKLLEHRAANFNPDLILGIANGGVFVSEKMFLGVKHIQISCRRFGSSGKDANNWIFKVVKSLPIRVRNILRIAEASLLNRMRNRLSRRVAILSEDDKAVLLRSKRILIVDDAVDSGSTMLEVYRTIDDMGGSRNIKSAVITITTTSPTYRPDFFLYNNSTLIRFPWAKDV